MTPSEKERIIRGLINKDATHLYDPIIINETVLYENKRPFSEQWMRLDALKNGPNLTCASVLDIGCNTGFLAELLLQQWNIEKYKGIDRWQTVIDIAEVIFCDVPNVDFEQITVSKKSNLSADYVFLLSVVGTFHDAATLLIDVAYKSCITGMYIEPTNHKKLSIPAYDDHWLGTLGEMCPNVSFLGRTDYQTRGIFYLEK